MVNEQGVSDEYKGSQRAWVEVGAEVGDEAKQVGRARPAHLGLIGRVKVPYLTLRVMGSHCISNIKKAFSPVFL